MYLLMGRGRIDLRKVGLLTFQTVFMKCRTPRCWSGVSSSNLLQGVQLTDPHSVID